MRLIKGVVILVGCLLFYGGKVFDLLGSVECPTAQGMLVAQATRLYVLSC